MTSTAIIQQMSDTKKEKGNKKKEEDNTKKEHYVPRFYLEKFSNLSPSGKEYKIWIFNKRSQQIPYSNNIKKTAVDGYFYDFPVDLVGEENKKIFDEYLQKTENIIAPFYKKFEKRLSYVLRLDDNQKYKTKVIKKREKKYWSYILAVQVLRTPEFRNLLKEVKQKATNENIIQRILEQDSRDHIEQIKTAIPKLSSEFIENIQDLLVGAVSEIVNVLYNDKLMSIPHYNFFLNHSCKLSKKFAKHKYMIGVNQSNIPFYTSDHPVARIPYIETGYNSEGIEILFPINSELILIIRDKKHPRNNERDGKLIILGKEEVTNYNKAQVYCSNQFIYCKENRFDLAQLLCQENPDICSEAKDRVKFINE